MQPHATSRLLSAVACLAALLFTPAVPAERVTLENGATLEGEIVKKNDTYYFVDLGFDIVRVPVANVASVVDVEAVEAAAAAAGSGGDASPEAANIGGVSYLEMPGATRQPATVKEMIDAARLGVVLVQCPSKSGAGFVVNKKGYIISNYHVVADEKYVDVTIYYREGGEVQKKKHRGVELVAYSQYMDISLLKIPDEDLDAELLSPIPIARSNNDAQGTQCFAIGNPGMAGISLEHTVSEGIVSSSERNFDDVLYVQTTASVNPGNSGGPLINRRGEVIGLVSMGGSRMNLDNVGLALPVDYIRYFLVHQRAFAFPDDKLNTGVRYLSPLY